MINSTNGIYDYVLQAGSAPRTILLLHGTGGTERDLIPLGESLDSDASLLSPRGNVVEGGMVNRFFARRTPTDIDVVDMQRRAIDLTDFVYQVAATHDLEGNSVTAIGYSNGANIALAAMLQGSGAIQHAALLRPVMYAPASDDLTLSGSRILILAGASDPFSSDANLQEMTNVLTQAQAEVTLDVNATAGHNLTDADLAMLGNWYHA